MNECYENEIRWPTKEERKESYGLFSVHEKAIAALDGTHCRIRIPKDDQSTYFSSYKKYHTQNFIIAVDGLGLVCYIAGPFPGKYNDRGVFNTLPFTNPSFDMLSDDECILVDGGFRGNGNVLYPYNKTELLIGDEAEKRRKIQFNEEFVKSRVLVEHCIHRVKNRAQVLASTFTKYRIKQRDLFFAAAKLYNRTRTLRLKYQLNHENLL
jgi:hypothetical protein